MAHKCHDNKEKLTAKKKSSRQKRKAHGKRAKLTTKKKSSRQKSKAHGKKEKLKAKKKSSRQKRKAHGKKEKLTAKKKSSRQKRKAHGKNEMLAAELKTYGGVFAGCHSSLACCMLFTISSFNAIYTAVACQCGHVFFLMRQRERPGEQILHESVF